MPIKNVSPRGDLYLVPLRRDVAFGEVFDLPAEDAREVLKQAENWVWVDEKGKEQPIPAELTDGPFGAEPEGDGK